MDNEKKETAKRTARRAHPITWDLPVLFGIMFALGIAELVFSVDTFQYKQKTSTWNSGTEKSRIAFLIFSSVRTILLSAVYIGFHFAQKFFGSMHHTFFLVLSTILWIVSGVLIHSLLGTLKCGGVEAPTSLKGDGLKISECHELQIIMALSWCLAAISVVACIPVVWRAIRERKEKKGGGNTKIGAGKHRDHNEKASHQNESDAV